MDRKRSSLSVKSNGSGVSEHSSINTNVLLEEIGQVINRIKLVDLVSSGSIHFKLFYFFTLTGDCNRPCVPRLPLLHRFLLCGKQLV